MNAIRAHRSLSSAEQSRTRRSSMAYYTIQKTGHGEYEEKRSRFLGEAIPVQSEEEVQEHLTRIRKQYYDARHHCSAYVLGEKKDRKKASDDGEPQGSAGLPILNVIEGAGCTGILIVVTRYFRRNASRHRRAGPCLHQCGKGGACGRRPGLHAGRRDSRDFDGVFLS